MSTIIDNKQHQSPKNPHFIVIRGDLKTVEAVGISYEVLIEHSGILDKRLWAYLKIVVPQLEKWWKVRLLLEEHCIPIICIDCPDYIQRCLEDAKFHEEGLA